MLNPGSGCVDAAREPLRSPSPLAGVLRMGVPTRGGIGDGALLSTEAEWYGFTGAVAAGIPVEAEAAAVAGAFGGEGYCKIVNVILLG